MKKNKNIIIVSCLLALFGGSAQIFASSKNLDNSANLPIRCDTTRLPEQFRQKFRLGDYTIDESDGDIRINRCNMDSKNLPKFVEAVREGTVAKFLKDFSSYNANEMIIYLEVGGGTYHYVELFEKFIVVRSGEILIDLCHGYRNPLGWFKESPGIFAHIFMPIKDDRNIVQALCDNSELGKAFQEGKAKIYVYHKSCQSLTSLYFDRHDEVVSKIDDQRAFFVSLKNAIKWGMAWKVSSVIGSTLGYIPLVSAITMPIIGCATTFAGCAAIYKTYHCLCPSRFKEIVNSFVKEKVESHIPILSVVKKGLQMF
ncbi:MAG: hypothetical protein LBQ03_01320 [Puniceicoccales bacterium]|jgi:hypothetical protein|nr:hypothetical protein [Puniceicoccales bacterium]